MKRVFSPAVWAWACTAILLQACTTAPPTAKKPDVSGDRQLLVMIRSDIRIRFQPGSSGLAEYGVTTSRGLQQTAASIARDYGLALVDDWPMPSLGMHCFLMQVSAAGSMAPTLAELNGDRRIEWAQPLQRYRTLAHTDPYYSLQTAAKTLRLDEAHQISTGKGVLIAEVDTGIDVDHPDLAGQVRDAENFVDAARYPSEIHGTAVAGVIAGRADNGVGIVGVAPSAALLGLRACRESSGGFQDASCDSFSLAKALQFALRHHADVINMSLTGPYDRLLAALIDKALAHDTVVVAAADPGRDDGGFPASEHGVVAVGVADSALSTEATTIFAPGRDVLTTAPPATWAFFSGSSIAAAHVSGVVALLLARKPGLSPALVSQALAGGGEIHAAHGTASLDACAALNAVAGPCACCSPLKTNASTVPVSQLR